MAGKKKGKGISDAFKKSTYGEGKVSKMLDKIGDWFEPSEAGKKAAKKVKKHKKDRGY